MMSSSFSDPRTISGAQPGAEPGSPLSIAIISPDRRRRIAAASSLAQCASVQTREIEAYPADATQAAQLLQRGFDAILIDLDADEALALEIVETLCIARTTNVMVFSGHAEPDLILRGMRAGAREFLTLPFAHQAMAKALAWVAAHRPAAPPVRTAEGRLHVFLGSKGGVGVTTVACNFAAALAEASSKSTLLLDLNLNLGDAALNLGIRASAYSTADALARAGELDAGGLRRLLTHHASGMAVLAAPLDLSQSKASNADIGRLLAVARQQFDYVVVDAGKKVDLQQMHLFEASATAYLVTQVGIPELRNANRLIAQFSHEPSPALEIVINRYQSRFLGLTEEHLNKALTRPVRWKIPNDFKAVREMQSSGTAILYQNSPIAGVMREMAHAVCGKYPPVARAAAAEGPARGFRMPWKSAGKPEATPRSTAVTAADAVSLVQRTHHTAA